MHLLKLYVNTSIKLVYRYTMRYNACGRGHSIISSYLFVCRQLHARTLMPRHTRVLTVRSKVTWGVSPVDRVQPPQPDNGIARYPMSIQLE